ncbi:MAG: tetratricopeptide repeat protein [Betaproteobacteria bacterium]|nr:tetratricopeptide repeat protein [Betaproteobacteria bacterium]
MSPAGRWLRRVAGAGLLGLALPLWAQELPACPAAFPVTPPETRTQREQALQELAGLNDACSTRADYFAWQGTLYLTLKRPQEAANALEKALLLNPDLAGAQLDYAQALAELGQNSSARDLVATVMARPDIPSGLHEWLTSRLGDLSGEPTWKTTGMVQTLLGGESNLNSAPSSAILNLTLPGGSVPVVLGQSQRPESGMASLNTAAFEATRPWGPGQVTLSGDATVRVTPGHADSNLQWVDGAALWTQPFLGGDAGVRASATRLWMGGIELYDETAGKLFVEHPVTIKDTACRYGIGGDYSARSYPAAPVLDGRYSGLELGLGCQRGDTLLTATGQWGLDRAQSPDRLGGNQQRDDYALSASHPWGPGLAIVMAQWSRLQDAQVYSPLLGGVSRDIFRRAGRLEYDYPLSKRWTALGYLEKTDQTSNVSLFSLDNQALYIGLRWGGK